MRLRFGISKKIGNFHVGVSHSGGAGGKDITGRGAITITTMFLVS